MGNESVDYDKNEVSILWTILGIIDSIVFVLCFVSSALALTANAMHLSASRKQCIRILMLDIV